MHEFHLGQRLVPLPPALGRLVAGGFVALVALGLAVSPLSPAHAQGATVAPLPSDSPSLQGLQTEHRVGQFAPGVDPSADWQGQGTQGNGTAPAPPTGPVRDTLAKPQLSKKEDFIAKDAKVIEATKELQNAQNTMEATLHEISELTAKYESNKASVETLSQELDMAPEAIEQSAQQILRAKHSRRALLRDSYKSVGLYAALTIPGTLNGASLQDNLHTRGALQYAITSNYAFVQRVELQADLQLQNFEIAHHSASGALQEITTLSTNEKRLNQLLDQAGHHIEQARKRLKDAMAAASKSYDGIVAAQARADAMRMAASGGGVFVEGLLNADYTKWKLATINGKKQVMTCPVGDPVNFIDSWGFPRSGGRQHKGVDMMAPRFTPVYAVADGYIQRVYNNNLGGLSINLIDSLGHKYYYAHLQQAFVTDGQPVKVGQHIAAVGNSGNARGTPPHNHFQFHPNAGPPVNPYPLTRQLCSKSK